MAGINITEENGLYTITLDIWEWTGLTVNGEPVEAKNQGNIQFQYKQKVPGPIHFIATANHYIVIVNPDNTMFMQNADNTRTYLCAISYHETASPKVVTLHGFISTFDCQVPVSKKSPLLFSQGRMTGAFMTVPVPKPKPLPKPTISKVTPYPNKNWMDVVWGEDKFLAVGYWGESMTSANGSAWTLNTPIGQSDFFSAVVYSGEKFVAICDYYGTEAAKEIYYSTDGKTWTGVSAPGAYFGLAWGNGTFVATGQSNEENKKGIDIATSSDGITWKKQIIITDDYVNKVVWGKDQFVAVGYNNTRTSPDGKTWTKHANKLNLTDLCWSKSLGLYVAVGGAYGSNPLGKIAISSDGINWQLQTTTANAGLYGVCWDDKVDRFVAVGGLGLIMTSTDGADWTVLASQTSSPPSPTTSELTNVTSNQGEFVAVSAHGVVVKIDYRS